MGKTPVLLFERQSLCLVCPSCSTPPLHAWAVPFWQSRVLLGGDAHVTFKQGSLEMGAAESVVWDCRCCFPSALPVGWDSTRATKNMPSLCWVEACPRSIHSVDMPCACSGQHIFSLPRSVLSKAGSGSAQLHIISHHHALFWHFVSPPQPSCSFPPFLSTPSSKLVQCVRERLVLLVCRP